MYIEALYFGTKLAEKFYIPQSQQQSPWTLVHMSSFCSTIVCEIPSLIFGQFPLGFYMLVQLLSECWKARLKLFLKRTWKMHRVRPIQIKTIGSCSARMLDRLCGWIGQKNGMALSILRRLFDRRDVGFGSWGWFVGDSVTGTLNPVTTGSLLVALNVAAEPPRLSSPAGS